MGFKAVIEVGVIEVSRVGVERERDVHLTQGKFSIIIPRAAEIYASNLKTPAVFEQL